MRWVNLMPSWAPGTRPRRRAGGMDDQEFAAYMLYRLAYGITSDRVEASRFDPSMAGARNGRAGGYVRSIGAEVHATGTGPPAPHDRFDHCDRNPRRV